MGGQVVSAGIVAGQLYISLSDGSVIPCGFVQGPQGLQGERGAIGSTGRPGADGNTILHSAGNPRPDLGRDGDFHINTVRYVIQLKENGVWGKPQPLLVDGSAMGTLDQGGKTITGGKGRFFPMGGVGSNVPAAPSNNSAGLQPILANGMPLGINRQMLCSDASGDLLKLILFFHQASGGVYSCEVVAMRGASAGSITIAWEMADPKVGLPTVNFEAVVNGLALEVWATSTGQWTEIRGGYLLL